MLPLDNSSSSGVDSIVDFLVLHVQGMDLLVVLSLRSDSLELQLLESLHPVLDHHGQGGDVQGWLELLLCIAVHALIVRHAHHCSLSC